jgi:hypothetical protein
LWHQASIQQPKDRRLETSPSLKVSYTPARASYLVPPRRDSQELLDMGEGSVQDVRENFADLRRINRYLGGNAALIRHLYPRLKSIDAPSTVVDVGTGSGDLIPLIGGWAARHQINLSLWGLDLSARNLAAAESPKPLIQADALNVPFQKNRIDYYISSLLLHHLSPEEVKMMLARTFEAARRGIIMSDLRRGWLPLVAFKLSQPIFACSYLTRHDGAVSIRRAYTPAELTDLAREAGLSNARVCCHPIWRMTLVADK